jgi:iron-sulfur cluster assembly accessory protein
MIQLSQSAIAEILRLRAKVRNSDGKLRLAILPSGCLNWSYSMSFDTDVLGGDRLFDCQDIEVIVDSTVLPYVNGLAIDYSEDLMGGGFRFHNPNAIQFCGCGNSFDIAEK